MKKVFSEKTGVIIIIAVICWVAFFWQSREFGLYEDDYSFVGIPISINNLSEVCQLSLHLAKTWSTSRPVGRSLAPFLGFVAYKIGGLWGIYLLCYTIITTNAVLFYYLMRYRFHHILSLFTALLFLLFPADTTKCLITHSLVLQVSMMYFLFAIHLYMKERFLLSYTIICLCLLTYESAFLLFFILPFYKQFRTSRKKYIYSALHIAILLGQIVFIWAIRIYIGNPRMVNSAGSLSSISTTLRKILFGCFIGPKTSLLSFYHRPLFVLTHIDKSTIILMAIFLPSFYLLLKNQLSDYKDFTTFTRISRNEHRIRYLKAIISDEVLSVWKFGILALVLSYLFSFTHYPPIITFGRGTSVHLAAAFGSSLIVAGLLLLLLQLGNRYRIRHLIYSGIALFLSLLVCVGFTIQNDFAKSWKYQKEFWGSVLPLLQDSTENSLIFVESTGLPQVRQIKSYQWAYPILLEHMYVFPQEWERPPRLFVVEPKWKEKITWQSGYFTWEMPAALWPKHTITLPTGNLVLIQKKQDTWIRRTGDIELANHVFPLKPKLKIYEPLPYSKTPLYFLLKDGDLRF